MATTIKTYLLLSVKHNFPNSQSTPNGVSKICRCMMPISLLGNTCTVMIYHTISDIKGLQCCCNETENSQFEIWNYLFCHTILFWNEPYCLFFLDLSRNIRSISQLAYTIYYLILLFCQYQMQNTGARKVDRCQQFSGVRSFALIF